MYLKSYIDVLVVYRYLETGAIDNTCTLMTNDNYDLDLLNYFNRSIGHYWRSSVTSNLSMVQLYTI